MFISISISCIYIYIDRHTHGYLFVIVKQGYYPCIYTLEHKVHWKTQVNTMGKDIGGEVKKRLFHWEDIRGDRVRDE